VAQLRSYFRYLLAEAKPKADKVAFVGHDFGAMYGVLLVQQENAIRHTVIMTAVPDFADWFLFERKLGDSDAHQYRQRCQLLHLRVIYGVLVASMSCFKFAENDDT